MTTRWLSAQVRRMFWSIINKRVVKDAPPPNLSAMVFAPHPDDETLGCGGTILLKKKAGADVKIVFMTDGQSSHGHFMPANQLVVTRWQESIAAADCLGVRKEDLAFFPFVDGQLSQETEQAIPCVAEMLIRHQPQEIYVPYNKESHTDHLATHQIVMAALEFSRISVTIYEYPVWFWNHWPWVDIVQNTPEETVKIAKESVKLGMGLSGLRDFRYTVPIESVLEEKRAALYRHESQMIRPQSIPDWPILSDVAHGKYLDCFFRPKEAFLRYPFHPKARAK